MKTKCAVYCVIVLLTLLYSAETWLVYKADVQRVQAYMILNVKWGLHIPNKSILEKSKLSDTYDILAQHNLRWAGYLNKLENSSLSKQILCLQLREVVT